MKMISLKICLQVIFTLAAISSAAQISGPTVVCPGSNYTYDAGGVPAHATWSVTNGTIVSRSGTNFTSQYITVNFTGSGVVTFNDYDPNENGPGWVLAQTWTLNVTLTTAGAVTGVTTVCPSTSFSLQNYTSAGNNFYWQSSPAGANSWSTFATTSAGQSQSASITQNTDFRVVSVDCSIASPAHTVNVYTGISSAGSIAGSTTICYGSTPATFTETAGASVSPSGTYQWQSRISSGSWTDISGATGSSYSSGALYQTTDFQRLIKWSCNSSIASASNVITVTVNQPSAGGTLASTNGSAFCSSGTVSLSLSGHTGSVTGWSYQYNDGSGWTSWSTFSSSSATTNSFSLTTNGTSNRNYQFTTQVQNGVCAVANSSILSVTVNVANTGSVSPSLLESFTPVNANFSLSGAVYTGVTWQQSADGVSWSNATGPNTSTTYTGTSSGSGVSISSSTKYRVQVINGTCTTNSAVLSVEISQSPIVRCASNPAYIAVGNSVTLHTTLNHLQKYHTYQWIKSGTDISGANDSIYVASEPAAYSVRVTASATSPSATSNPFNVYAIGLQPDNTVNAVATTILRTAGVTEATDIYALPAQSIRQSVQYLDLQSRPIQTISIGQSPLQKDVVVPYRYDTLSPTMYLPYVAATKDGSRRTTAIDHGGYTASDQYLFYQQSNTKIATSTAPYAKTVYENSPSSVVLEQGAPGTDWQPGNHTVKQAFNTNNNSFKVRMWTTAGPSGYYTAKTLGVSKVTDENGNPVMSYSDKLGRTILKRVKTSNMSDTTTWLETYYVYDARGNLALQVPPKVSALLNAGTAWSTTLQNKWCFVYTYDARNRLVEKQVPGTAVGYYVYDPLDRLVLSQDGNMRTLNQWSFVKYDIKGRLVMSGLYTNATETSRAAMQSVADTLYSNPAHPWYEDRGTTSHGYTNQSFPVANRDSSPTTALNVNYYDNYDFDYNLSDDFSYTSQGLAGESAQGNSFGLATGGKRLVIGTSNWLYTYQFYDRFGRVIQQRSNNHLSLTVDNVTTFIYDFEGKIVTTKNYHNAGGTNQYTILQTPTYDNQGRTLYITHQINGGTPQVVVQYQYNELGQVVMKQLHKSGANFLQNIDYRYNIRGWLSSINNATLTDDSNVTNGDTNDYFGLELSYNTNAGMSNGALYDGNVSAVRWKNAGSQSGTADQRSYAYTYDKSNRILAATFQANTGSAWTREANTLNETISYDHNGNINTLIRNYNHRGLSGSSSTSSARSIDSLTYSYTSGNQLSKVTDLSTIEGGFNDGANDTTEYSYNATGSLTLDRNKGISSVIYNVLGLPQQINFTNGNVISYTYDAGGNKLTVTATVDSLSTTTQYSSGFVYHVDSGASVLSFFSSPEGRVVKNAAGNFEYQYAIADHQGNTRVLFSSAAQSAQSVTAGFEDADQIDEEGDFVNYPSGGQINTLAMNAHTGTNSLYLNGGYSGQVGLAKSYKVFPGDKLHIKAFAKYLTPSETPGNLAGFATALLNAFTLSAPGSGETGTPSSAINALGSLAAGGFGDGTTDETDPKVFVTIAIFDKNYQFLDVAFQQLTSADSLQADYTVKEAGYAFMYVSNENPTLVDVYFDDVTMSITPSALLQGNEYYAYGMQTANSWTRDNEVANNFLANGGTELNPASALYDLEFRNYDPILGRMNQVDPLADGLASFTPYNFCYNNPLGHTDVNGARPGDWWEYGYNAGRMMMDGPGGGGPGNPEPDHPFRGWMGMMNGGYYPGMFGYDGDRPFGAGMDVQMRLDAQSVRNGTMTVSEYANLYGQPIDHSSLPAFIGYVTQNQLFVAHEGNEFYAYNIFLNEKNQAVTGTKTPVTQNTEGGWLQSGANIFMDFTPGSELWEKISNYMTGIGLAVDGAIFSLGRKLDKRLAYSPRRPGWGQWSGTTTAVGPTRILGINFSTSFVKGTANTLKIGGAVLGGIGMGMSAYEIYTGKKELFGEGGLDLLMGGVAFVPGGGWIISGLYFGGKWALEASGNDFWNKP